MPKMTRNRTMTVQRGMQNNETANALRNRYGGNVDVKGDNYRTVANENGTATFTRAGQKVAREINNPTGYYGGTISRDRSLPEGTKLKNSGS